MLTRYGLTRHKTECFAEKFDFNVYFCKEDIDTSVENLDFNDLNEEDNKILI